MSITPRAARDALRRPWLPLDPDIDVSDDGRPVHLRPEYAFYVAVGGFLGTGLREALALRFPLKPDHVNWTILLINVVGAFVLGALLEWLAGRGPDRGRRRTTRLLLGTGVLGGFTTYSTFATGAAQLVQHHHSGMAIGYCGMTVGVGLLASYAGVSAALAVRRAVESS